jgi:hypothetical protein
MTQGRHWWDRGQRRIVQTRTLVTWAVTRAKRLALVLALTTVVAASAVIGFGAAPAEAQYYWEAWLTPAEAAYWEVACYYDWNAYPLYVYDEDYYGNVYPAWWLGVNAYKQYIICSPY